MKNDPITVIPIQSRRAQPAGLVNHANVLEILAPHIYLHRQNMGGQLCRKLLVNFAIVTFQFSNHPYSDATSSYKSYMKNLPNSARFAYVPTSLGLRKLAQNELATTAHLVCPNVSSQNFSITYFSQIWWKLPRILTLSRNFSIKTISFTAEFQRMIYWRTL